MSICTIIFSITVSVASELCSVRAEVRANETYPLIERKLFLIPDPVPCNGYVQSWQGHVFSPTTNAFDICISVLRPAGEVYGRVGSQQITIGQNSTNFTVTANSIINVEYGDRIAIDFQQCMTVSPVEQDDEITRVVEYRNLTTDSEGNTPDRTGIYQYFLGSYY